MALYKTRTELEAEGIDASAIIREYQKRVDPNYMPNPQYNGYDEAIVIGANDLENRPEDIFFANKEDYNEWRNQL